MKNSLLFFIFLFLSSLPLNAQKWLLQCCFYAKMHARNNLWRNRNDLIIVQLANGLLLQLKKGLIYAS